MFLKRLFGKKRDTDESEDYENPRMREPSDQEFGATFVDSEHNMPGDQDDPPTAESPTIES